MRPRAAFERRPDWPFPWSCRSTTKFYEQLLTSNYRAIKNAVFTTLGIERSTRRLKGNVLRSEDGTPSSVQDAYWQSKALAYELLVSYLFTCLDEPQSIRSNCQLSDKGEPHSFATSGKADIVEVYDGFRVVIEVTSKKYLRLHRPSTSIPPTPASAYLTRII